MAGTSNNSGAGDSKDKDCRWYFTAEQLANSPSRRHGIDADQELSFRQLTAYLIQEMGQRLQVSQLCINTAIVYMHRFYAFHSFTHFHRNGIAAASLFLAAKVEEQPRKLEHVIKVSHMCLNQEAPHPSTEAYAEEAQGLVFNENVLLQTLGFDVAIDHPHTHVVKTCHLVKACKDLAQTSYFLASNSLHLTSMCLQYGPTVVACFCIYLACKWSRWEIPQSTEGKHWFHYVDKTVTMDLLKKLTDEFIAIYEKSPARLKSKLNSIKALVQGAKIAEPPRNISESSNGSSSQLASIDPPRRPESFSSHHRSHHSSHANASHHHHGKQIPLVESAASEHKPIPTHKQPFPAAALSQSNRAKPERSQVSGESPYIGAQHATSKQPPSIPNNSRTSSSGRASHNAAPSSSSVPQPRVPHGHDVNYHKSRSVVPPQTNPPMPSHKLPVKSAETSRNTVKDSVSRGTEPGKNQAKHSSNMHPLSNTVPEASRNVVPPPSSGLSHQQRAYFPPNSNRTSSSGSNTVKSNSSIKHEQSVQQQAHMHVSQKQSTESSFTSANVRQVEDPSKMGDQMEICSPPKYSSYSPSTTQPATLQSQQSQSLNQPQSKSMSIFSPEWNEKSLHPMTSIPGNIGSSNGSSKPVGYSIKQSKDSPKKIERDRRSDTIKKERGRPSEVPIAETSKMVSSFDRKVAPPPSGMNKRIEFPVSCPSSSTMPFDLKIKQEHPHVHSMGGFKRPATAEMNSRIADDNALREFKLRKLEPQSPPKFMEQKNFPPMYEPTPVSDARIAKSFPATINGIETNPDLVSSLLKESLCNDSKFPGAAMLKTEPKEPDDLSLTDFAVPTETLPQQILQSDVPTKSEIPSNLDELLKSKSEKKKKKEKHKHKEKDKTKDKEEKKKHKKDKDKHKERERDRLSSGAESAEQNPMKIKIYKDKMNLPVVEASHPPPPTGFKIKIPKDRIKGEISNFPLEESSSSLPAPSSIKIKISKDKVETYSQSSQDVGGSGVYINSVNHIHSSSNKKKDKDRDKEKEKRKSGNDPHRHNGSNLTGSNVAIDSMSKPLPSNLHKIWPN